MLHFGANHHYKVNDCCTCEYHGESVRCRCRAVAVVTLPSTPTVPCWCLVGELALLHVGVLLKFPLEPQWVSTLNPRRKWRLDTLFPAVVCVAHVTLNSTGLLVDNRMISPPPEMEISLGTFYFYFLSPFLYFFVSLSFIISDTFIHFCG